jgi:hypothetical protein
MTQKYTQSQVRRVAQERVNNTVVSSQQLLAALSQYSHASRQGTGTNSYVLHLHTPTWHVSHAVLHHIAMLLRPLLYPLLQLLNTHPRVLTLNPHPVDSGPPLPLGVG